VLARLSKTLSTNVAIAGLTALVLGAGGATVSLAASSSPNDHASDTAKQKVAENADKPEDAEDSDDADENDADENESAEDQGTRPTDTHGYCVSQVAKAPLPEGSTVTHGSLVSAAAHACGKESDESKGAAKSAEKKAAAASRAAAGKAHAKHTTGKPTG
jgi:hypothetical protein